MLLYISLFSDDGQISKQNGLVNAVLGFIITEFKHVLLMRLSMQTNCEAI